MAPPPRNNPFAVAIKYTALRSIFPVYSAFRNTFPGAIWKEEPCKPQIHKAVSPLEKGEARFYTAEYMFERSSPQMQCVSEQASYAGCIKSLEAFPRGLRQDLRLQAPPFWGLRQDLRLQPPPPSPPLKSLPWCYRNGYAKAYGPFPHKILPGIPCTAEAPPDFYGTGGYASFYQWSKWHSCAWSKSPYPRA